MAVGWLGSGILLVTKQCQPRCGQDDLAAVTKIVNGGRNGLEDRRRYLAKAKTAVAALEADALSSVQVFPVLRRGMHGEPVELLHSKTSGR